MGPRAFARLVLRLSALPCAGVGLAFLAAPAAMGSLVGLELTSVTADNDVRAVYGGVSSGLALFLWVSASRPDWLVPGLAAQLLTFGGLALARVLSWAVAGWPGPIAHLLHAGEIVGIAAAALALRGLGREARR